MSIVKTDVPMTYALLEQTVLALTERYPALRREVLGKTAGGRELLALVLGDGPRRVLFSAAHHANEWITAPALLQYMEDTAQAGENGKALPAAIYAVPMVDPDGVDLVTGAIASGSAEYEQAARLAEFYPAVPFPDGWKANLLGVDLNLNYPAGWLQAREIKFLQGYTRPGPRDYVGHAPLDQIESRLLADYTAEVDPALVVALHSQGEEIYWQFRDIPVPGARELGERMAAASGYRLADTPYNSSFAGYKDWFIQEYHRPGYTVEVGQGTNPLPLSQFGEIYRAVREILDIAAAGLPVFPV